MKSLLLTLTFALLVSTLFATQEKKQVKIRLQTQTGHLDEVTIYFDQSINPTYNSQEDAQKQFSGVAGVPTIFSPSIDNVPCSINGFGTLSSTEVVALGCDVDADGQYSISASQLFNFDPTSIIRLEDKQTGTFHDLRAGAYSANLLANDPAIGRFFVHVSFPTQFSSSNAGCLNNDGKIMIAQDNSIQWTLCNLYDEFNQQVATYSNVNGNFDFSNLPAGNYYLVFVYGSYTTTKNFELKGNFIVADVDVSTQTAYTFQEIDFRAIAMNSSQYRWEFGDGSLITGVANPTFYYFEPGVYEVKLIASNQYGCSDNASVIINVENSIASSVDNQPTLNSSIVSWGSTVTVNIENIINAQIALDVYSLTGAAVYSSTITEPTTQINLSELPIGYYVASVKSGSTIIAKKIFIGR